MEVMHPQMTSQQHYCIHQWQHTQLLLSFLRAHCRAVPARRLRVAYFRAGLACKPHVAVLSWRMVCFGLAYAGPCSTDVAYSARPQVDPSGSYWPWKACAIGKNMVNAKT